MLKVKENFRFSIEATKLHITQSYHRVVVAAAGVVDFVVHIGFSAFFLSLTAYNTSHILQFNNTFLHII